MGKQSDTSEFHATVALPPGLTISSISNSIDYIERELVDLVEIYLEQMNVFSAIVGIYGTKALDQNSVYQKVRHIDVAQTRFPDLKRKNSGPNPICNHCLESKGSKRPWAIQSHYNHEGWYIVWRYFVDVTLQSPVVVWRVDVVYLKPTDWKYEGSTAGAEKAGRTHTYGVPNPSQKLKGCSVFQRSGVRLRGGKPVREEDSTAGRRKSLF
jgi:hypothetical protein